MLLSVVIMFDSIESARRLNVSSGHKDSRTQAPGLEYQPASRAFGTNTLDVHSDEDASQSIRGVRQRSQVQVLLPRFVQAAFDNGEDVTCSRANVVRERLKGS